MIQDALSRLLDGEDLTRAESRAVMDVTHDVIGVAVLCK